MMKMEKQTYHVAVIGCGIAGSMAAVAAARNGAKVIAIDEAGYPGGALTSMGTGPMMTFHAGEKQVIRGLAQEMIDRMAAKGFTPGHTVDSTGYTYTVTPFSAEGMKCTLEEMMLEAGVTLLYHTTVHGAKVSDGILQSIVCFSCGENFTISADLFIDATGDGDLLALAGVPFSVGREGDEKNQPMTMNFKISDIDTAKIRAIMEQQPELFPFLSHKPGIEKRASRLSVSGFQEIMKKGIAEGKIHFDRDIVLTFETDIPGEMIVNMSRINGESPIEPFSITRAEVEGRKQVFELLAYLRENVPGYEKARLLFSGPNVGIRSSRQMKGSYTLTADDILSNRIFPDRVAAFGYPIDIHSADGAETKSVFLKEGTYYTIPYRCLTNETIKNLVAAGRNISCSFEAQASTRLSPCCAALGEAAGCACALALRNQTIPTDIDISELQQMLIREGAFLGESE